MKIARSTASVSRRSLSSKFSQKSDVEFKPKIIETVPKDLHKYLFPGIPVPSTSSSSQIPLQLPCLTDRTITDHFRKVSQRQIEAYHELLIKASQVDLEEAQRALNKIDTKKSWVFRSGWTRYSFDGIVTEVDYPKEDFLFFDVEVCVTEGNLPTLAIALATDAWYGWCSQRLVEGAEIPMRPTQENLIPLGDTSRERVVIGHNVGYDRARCREPYDKKPGKIRFMDTMSMSIPMFGMADHQQTIYEKNDIELPPEMEWLDAWKRRVSRNSLAAVHDHFFFDPNRNSRTLAKKEKRASFVKDSIEDIRNDFQALMTYCAYDNVMCAQIYFKLWPEFQTRFPHPATLAGMLNMGNAYLPINQNWPMFYDMNTKICEEKKKLSARAIVSSARESLDSGITADDVWLWMHSWDLNRKTGYPEWYCKLFKNRTNMAHRLEELTSDDIVLKSAVIPCIFGLVYGPYPMMRMRNHGWGYLVPTKSAETSNEILLKLPDAQNKDLFLDFPLKKFVEEVQKNRFMYGEIPLDESKGLAVDQLGLVRFYQLAHPSGEGNVGDPLTKHYAKDLEANVIRPTRFLEEFKVVLDSLQATRFWTSYSDRFRQEVAIWSEDSGEKTEQEFGAIAPAIVPAGTVSRRSVHKLWVTLTNQFENSMIGSGIKSMVQAPPGYRLVGADVDSQEQWLAALFGDACEEKSLPIAERVVGKTAFSNMMLGGSKSDGTDLHSVVAKQLSISRGNAKTLNYARLYGSGEKHACRHLMLVGAMKEEDAIHTAHELFRITKGEEGKWKKLKKEAVGLLDKYVEEKVGNLHLLSVDGEYYLPDYSNRLGRSTQNFEEWLMRSLAQSGLIDESFNNEKLFETFVPRLYEDFIKTRSFYYGGYESSTFNFLEMAAETQKLKTPVLDCQLADSLAHLPVETPRALSYQRKYKRSVMNWTVQSSAVDFLHLLLVSMEWLCKEYAIDARFVISIHDEVRYLCSECEAPRVGLALMLSNMFVRAFISEKVGIPQLPLSVAFFSQVDCDTVLRKEIDSACSNPDGSSIPKGVAWDIDDLLRLTGGSLKKSC